jgi:hypothetical protein
MEQPADFGLDSRVRVRDSSRVISLELALELELRTPGGIVGTAGRVDRVHSRHCADTVDVPVFRIEIDPFRRLRVVPVSVVAQFIVTAVSDRTPGMHAIGSHARQRFKWSKYLKLNGTHQVHNRASQKTSTVPCCLGCLFQMVPRLCR